MNEDFKITLFFGKRKEIEVSHIPGAFVKVEHVESGITVTKYAKYAIDALREAQEECNKLVEIYNRRGEDTINWVIDAENNIKEE